MVTHENKLDNFLDNAVQKILLGNRLRNFCLKIVMRKTNLGDQVCFPNCCGVFIHGRKDRKMTIGRTQATRALFLAPNMQSKRMTQKFLREISGSDRKYNQ